MSTNLCPITKLAASLLTASAGKLRNAKAEKTRAEKLAPLCDAAGAAVIAGLLKTAPGAAAKSSAKALAGQWASIPIGGAVPLADGTVVAVADYVAELLDKARDAASAAAATADTLEAAGLQAAAAPFRQRATAAAARIEKMTARLELEAAATAAQAAAA